MQTIRDAIHILGLLVEERRRDKFIEPIPCAKVPQSLFHPT